MSIDPYRGYNFKLEFNGTTGGHFTECSGLTVQVESIKYREAGDNQIERHIPGSVEYATVTLRYGISSSQELWEWLMQTAAGDVQRKNVSIILFESTGSHEEMRWNLIDAWPSEWQGAGLNAADRAIAIESLTLVFDSLERA